MDGASVAILDHEDKDHKLRIIELPFPRGIPEFLEISEESPYQTELPLVFFQLRQ